MENIPNKFSKYNIKKLKGDGSDRVFSRIVSENKSYILMIDGNKANNEKYLKAYELYKRINIKVPAIIEHNLNENYILFEDIGDVHFKDYVNSSNKEEYLKKAVRIIISLQYFKNNKNTYHNKFDIEVFNFESNYAFTNYCENYLKRPQLRDKYFSFFDKLNNELDSLCDSLTHRDYHGDNIMVSNKELYLIDYQDTRLGPLTYDLTSLLLDRSSLHFSEVKGLKDYFFEEYNIIAKLGRSDFEHIFSMSSIQRMFKILGSFSYLSAHKGNPKYLEFINPTLKYLDFVISNSDFKKDLSSFVEDLK